jgi:Nucleotidyltransferase-like/Helix-turn-helix domain
MAHFSHELSPNRRGFRQWLSKEEEYRSSLQSETEFKCWRNYDMEDILRPIYQERASNRDTLGVLLIEKSKSSLPVTDNQDALLVVIVKKAEVPLFIKHYHRHDTTAALYTVTEEQLYDWLTNGSNRRVVDWIFNGQILFDRNEYLETLKKQLDEFPYHGRYKKIGIEFAKLIRRFIEGKAFFTSGNHLDSFNHMVHALHHLARLSVLEHGFHPEVTVWSQVKKLEPEVYKLYEELVESKEGIEKRLELLFLASEFLLNQRIDLGSKHLLSVMKQKQEPWTFQQLMTEEEIAPYSIDLGIVLDFLVEKELVFIYEEETKGKNIYHRYYTTR